MKNLNFEQKVKFLKTLTWSKTLIFWKNLTLSKNLGLSKSAENLNFFRLLNPLKIPPHFPVELERKEAQERLESANRQIIAEIEDLKRTLRDSSALVQKYRKELSGGEAEGSQEEAQSSSGAVWGGGSNICWISDFHLIFWLICW